MDPIQVHFDWEQVAYRRFLCHPASLAPLLTIPRISTDLPRHLVMTQSKSNRRLLDAQSRSVAPHQMTSIACRLGRQRCALVFLCLYFEFRAADLLVPLLRFPEFLPDSWSPDCHQYLAPFVCGLALAWHDRLVFVVKKVRPANEHLLATLKGPFEWHILTRIEVRACKAKTSANLQL